MSDRDPSVKKRTSFVRLDGLSVHESLTLGADGANYHVLRGRSEEVVLVTDVDYEPCQRTL